MKLHTWLDEHGKTAAWLAEKTGLSASYLSRLIGRNGVAERSPSIETCAKIEEATAGGVTAIDFMPERKRKRVRPSGREMSRSAA
jgi:transcriptional regulator with XRE-family HTH domain